MPYVTFEDEAAPVKRPAPPAKTTSSGGADGLHGPAVPAAIQAQPVASTSNSTAAGLKSPAAGRDLDDRDPNFKKRKRPRSGQSNSRSPAEGEVQDAVLAGGNEATEAIEASTSSSHVGSVLEKGKTNVPSPNKPAKRVRTFHDNVDDNISEDDRDNDAAKNLKLDVRPGESRKQARKRVQSDRLERAQQLLASRQKLPVYYAKDAILSEIAARDTVIILGETGSGKTTQVPQFLLSSQICRPQPRIAVTQPRRVAATSLARRVSEEVGCALGSVVGYSVRFDDTSSAKTRLKYLTDGTLLQEILGDRLLESYDVVVIDEAHERTLRTDMILGFLKDIQSTRQSMVRNGDKGSDGNPITPLKLVVMSATIDAQQFSDFFDQAKILFVKGRSYTVKTMYLNEPTTDYVDAALKAIFQVHYKCPPGDVLVFLAGQDEIENLRSQLESYIPTLDPTKQQMLICSLYARLTPAEQNKAFNMAPPNTRKIILATNVAETSITLPGIKYVVDTGMQKEKTFHPATGLDSLLLTPISKNSATQRAGRAGRESSGICYRLYTENSYQSMRKSIPPEIQRCSLAFALLHLLAYGQNDVTKFNFMDRPAEPSIASALMELFALGATDHKGHITALGRRMAALPLEPNQAKILLASFEHECASEVIDLLALLGSADSLLSVSFQNREAAAEARSKFIHRSGDHMMLLNILKAFQELCHSIKDVKERKTWCRDHFFSYKALLQVLDARKQIRDRVKRLDPHLNCDTTAADDDRPILQCLLEGQFNNTAIRMPDGTYRRTSGTMRIKIHPGSILHGRSIDAIVFTDLTFTTNIYARLVSSIPLIWLRTKAASYFQHETAPSGPAR